MNNTHSNSRAKSLLLDVILFVTLIANLFLTIFLYYFLTRKNILAEYDLTIAIFVSSLICFVALIIFCYENLRLGNVKKQQEKDIGELNSKLTYEMQELALHNEKMKLLIDLSDMVQVCANLSEVIKEIEIKCKKILHFASGILYIADPSRKFLELAINWGEPVASKKIISADECWALRRGITYQVKNPQADLICEHVKNPSSAFYMCLPLIAQNTLLGLLHLNFLEKYSLTEQNKILISAVGQALSLALANIELRETLRNQSLHDSLTNLYNRRYLDEFLVKVLQLARRSQANLAIIMIDIDLFKQFNDTYGHEAGDLILQELGKLFLSEVRSSDIVARYGGEEFIWVLYDCGLEQAKKFAENLREKVSSINTTIGNYKLSNITISLGISIFPDNGNNVHDLINSADKALYQAKIRRNNVITYSEI